MRPLQFETVTLTWCSRLGETPVLRDFSLEVEAGQTVALMGPNGCGKSTLLRLATGLLSPNAGTVRWGKQKISTTESKRAYVPQNPQLFPWMRVWENVAFGLRLRGFDHASRKNRAMALLDRLGLAAWSQNYPDSLSGGMRARVALAMAFAPNPEMVCLDESLGPLDFQTREVVLEFIRKERERKALAVLLVTHQVADALRMERVVVMSPKPSSIVLDILVPDRSQVGEENFEDQRRIQRRITGVLGEVSQEAFLNETKQAPF